MNEINEILDKVMSIYNETDLSLLEKHDFLNKITIMISKDIRKTICNDLTESVLNQIEKQIGNIKNKINQKKSRKQQVAISPPPSLPQSLPQSIDVPQSIDDTDKKNEVIQHIDSNIINEIQTSETEKHVINQEKIVMEYDTQQPTKDQLDNFILKLIGQGKGVKEIQDILNKKGYKTVSGKSWGYHNIYGYITELKKKKAVKR